MYCLTSTLIQHDVLQRCGNCGYKYSIHITSFEDLPSPSSKVAVDFSTLSKERWEVVFSVHFG